MSASEIGSGSFSGKNLSAWNDTDVEYPERNSTIHALFELAVDRAPDRVALEFEGQTLTYAELNKRANQLARHLRGYGVGPDVPVGLCVERSLEMVVGLLGILKAGGAYVPLDPDYPAERLRAMLESASPPVVLTQRHLRDRLTSAAVPCFELDGDWSQVQTLDATNLVGLATPSNLAYIIYTSGSTGTPKGVMNEHRGVVNRLLWMQAEYQIGVADRVLQKTPFSFDVSVWEFFWPFLAGARLVVARPGGHRDPSYLARLIQNAGVTITHFVPSMLGLFLEEPGLESSCRGLKHVFASGEALSEDLARFCLRRIVGARLHNLYVPTEAAVDVTYHECRLTDPAGPVPIGRPIANLRTYVLAADMKPVSPGEMGELYLGGIGVARGYWNQPALTAERFLADPFSNLTGARMYQTGDLARWLPGGELEYLGRIDFQVKLRGFRIELGEIETALVRLADGEIRQAVVTTHEACPGNPLLVAYLLGGSTISDTAIRAGLARTLPEYMVPSAYVRLTAFPLTTSGKVDRKALPVPELGRVAFVAPRTALEQSLAEIWQELLGLERVGIHDHFFRLGGNSLTAARFVARVHDLGYQVSVRLVFEHPTIANIADAIIGQSDQPRTESLSDRAIPRLPAGRESLASYAQQRLWFIDQLEGPGLSAYNISTVTRLEGKLSVEALRLALVDLVDRHEPLRTSFELRDGKLMQVVQERFTVDLPVDDLREQIQAEGLALTTVGELPGCVRQCVANEADRPFDLAIGPMLRARLLHTKENGHIVVLTVHHIAADGWSMGVLWRELGEAYKARLTGNAARFPQLPVRYADYAAWQREVLVDDQFANSMVYWKQRLAGLEDLELPADRMRPAVLSYRGDRVDFTLPVELVERLRVVCSQTGTTLHMALLAAFQGLLGRLTDREDLAVGVPTVGRPRAELEGLIGFFVNTLVLRADLCGLPSYRTLLERTQQASLDAQEHDAVPFERLVEELQPERHRNRNPLVQVTFQYLDTPTIDFTAGGLQAKALPDPGRHARFDLDVLVRQAEENLKFEVSYATDLFDHATIERFAHHYEQYLTAAVANPDRSLAEISLVGPAEVGLLEQWNDTAAEYPATSTVHDLFTQQAARTPHATALVFGPELLSYAELDRASSRLAVHLRKLGAGPNTVVALGLPRSSQQIITLLGILKSGAAYLPLDPANPPERNSLILAEARAVALITNSETQAKLPATELPTLLVDMWDAESDTDSVMDSVSVEITSEDLAYVMYTSGSTGVPKGVMVEHRSIARLVFGQTYATFGPDRVFLQLALVAFDASTFEIWGALLHGGTLVIAPEGPLDPAELGALIAGQRVTTLWLTAGLFNEIVDTSPEILRGVQEILTGGEALSPWHVQKAIERVGPETRIINGYGPTECTTFACCHAIPHKHQAVTGTIPIGRPISNTRAYVLDPSGNQAPIGVTGSLFLGGPGVARGYLNQPTLTAERFQTDPFSTDPGARMYLTGDHARWLADGTLEFLGRQDGQVKLRGFRIELGEIETVLRRLPNLGIRQALVVAHESQPGNKILVAYLVGGEGASDEKLRQGLERSLPTYMIPAVFMRLASLPLTPNGKVDRKALPQPELTRDASTAFVAPRTRIEQTLAEIWQELLAVDRVGIHDSFFQLGGHSLLAVRLLSAIHDRLGLDLSLAKVFQYPTIAGLAQELEAQIPERTRPVLEVLRAGRHDLPPLVVMQGAFGDIFPGWQRAAQAFPEDRTIYAVRVAGSQPFWDGCDTLEELAREVAKLLIEKDSFQPVHLAGWSFGGFLAYEVARQLAAQRFPVCSVLIFDTGPECLQRLPGQPGRRLFRDLSSMFVNLPAWMGDYSDLLRNRNWWLKMASRARGKFVRSRLPAQRTTPEFLQADEIPTLYRQRGDISYQMLLGYRFGPYAGRVTLFRCRTRWLIHRAYDRFLGWDRYVQGPLQELFIPGPHDGFLSAGYQASHSASIAAELRFSDAACLADWESASIYPASP